MRLSDVQGQKTFEVVSKVIPSIISIASDKRVTETLAAGKEEKDRRTDAEIAAEKASKVLPLILNDHRDATVEILAAIKGVTPDEFLENVNLMNLTVDVFEMLTDEVIVGFLISRPSDSGFSEDASGNAPA